MLGAGCFAELQSGELRVRTYWQPPRGIDVNRSEESTVEEIRAALQDAVSLRLVADVPVGVFLSGGMDSSAIVALATRASAAPVHTFTVTFNETAYDESAFAQQVAQRFGAEHHVVPLTSRRALDHIDDALDALDQPSADGTNTYFVAQAAREAGLAVALSGIGGDEIFAGYPGFRRFAWLRSHARSLRRIPSHVYPRLPPSRLLPTGVRKGLALATSRGDPFLRCSATMRAGCLPAPTELQRLAGWS